MNQTNQANPVASELNSQKVIFREVAHGELLKGAGVLAQAVASTMGPSGHSVIIDNDFGAPTITKDGVTVARSINLKDRLQSMGAELLKEVASKTNDLAGDGPQPLYAKVLTPQGWTTMGELKVGDRICGANNTIQTVMGAYPKGKRTVYEVTTFDGRTIECCEDHLWSIKTYSGKPKILSTKQILKDGLRRIDLKGNKRTKYYLPNTSVEYDNDVSLPLDPYLLGTLLGLGSNEKFIPVCCLQSSVQNRERLLSGLLNANGHYNKRGLFEFSTDSKQLHADFVTLCRSLGKQVRCGEVQKKPGSSFGSKTLYRVVELKGHKHGLKIEKIVATNKRVEMRCIKVSNADQLYITNDFVVTHNTTTATVLGYALLKEGIKQISTGRSSIHVKKGMEVATEYIVDFLKNNCMPVSKREDIVNVGTISANGDREIGELLASAIEKVGKDGIITIEPAKSVQTSLDIVEGMQLDKGFVSPFFVTNAEKSTCELENPYILTTSNKISSISEIMNVLEKVARAEKPLLIVAEDVEGDALHTLIVNKMKGVLNVCAVKAPSYGEHRADILSDLTKVVGGEVFGATSSASLKSADLAHLGRAKKVVVSRGSCVIVGDPNDTERKTIIQERIVSLRTALETDNTLDDLRIHRYRERLAKLAGGIAVIKVGGSTEVEIKEKKDRVEDAVNATLAATQEGIVPGGGVALFYASQALRAQIRAGKWNDHHDDVINGIKIISDACEVPLRTIVGNTGQSADVVANRLLESYRTNPNFRIGYNAATKNYTDLIQEGIIDPVKVTRYCVEHAVSVVGLVLTCNAVVVNEN